MQVEGLGKRKITGRERKCAKRSRR